MIVASSGRAAADSGFVKGLAAPQLLSRWYDLFELKRYIKDASLTLCMCVLEIARAERYSVRAI